MNKQFKINNILNSLRIQTTLFNKIIQNNIKNKMRKIVKIIQNSNFKMKIRTIINLSNFTTF